MERHSCTHAQRERGELMRRGEKALGVEGRLRAVLEAWRKAAKWEMEEVTGGVSHGGLSAMGLL